MSKILALLSLWVLTPGARLTAAEVTLTVADGAPLKATYHAAGSRGPAVLLVHQCNADRASWESLASDLARAGLHVLAPDLRGFGANRVSGRVPSEKWAPDLDAWWAYLKTLPDVDPTRMAAGGASCGVPESAMLAARHPDVRALVLLSGVVNLDGRDRIAAAPELAVFGAVAEQDGPDSLKDLIAVSRNRASTLKIFPGGDHGVDLFRAHPELPIQLREWLRTQLLRERP